MSDEPLDSQAFGDNALLVTECWGCGEKLYLTLTEVFTWPSIIIDPVTDRPPNVGPDGNLTEIDPEGMARSKRMPLCKSCTETIKTTGGIFRERKR